MKTFLLSITLLVSINICNAYADIAPNPIKAKGIISADSCDVRMQSELVVVDLYNDSSHVVCYFHMHNQGESQDVNIGFPKMNFYHYSPKEKSFEGTFQVLDNGVEVKDIEDYSPRLIAPNDKDLVSSSYNERPWYLWDSHFEKGETKLIKVSYNLPTGFLRSGVKYFTYLLSTGSGWNGPIGKAEIIINLMETSSDYVFDITPGGFFQTDKQIKWTFTDVEPTTETDIRIHFRGKDFGGYETIETLYVINNELVKIAGNGPLNSINPENILSIEVLKDSSQTRLYTDEDAQIVRLFTKTYALDILKNMISLNKKVQTELEAITVATLKASYCIKVDDKIYDCDDMLRKLIELQKTEVRKVRIKSGDKGQRVIHIDLKQ